MIVLYVMLYINIITNNFCKYSTINIGVCLWDIRFPSYSLYIVYSYIDSEPRIFLIYKKSVLRACDYQ